MKSDKLKDFSGFSPCHLSDFSCQLRNYFPGMQPTSFRLPIWARQFDPVQVRFITNSTLEVISIIRTKELLMLLWLLCDNL